MAVPGHLLAGDFASMILDLVPDAPCYDDGIECTLRALVDYMIPATLVFSLCIAIGFVLAISLSVVGAARARATSRSRPRRRLLSSPIRTDGTWVRLVEDQYGRRMVEVLEGVNWKASTRDVSGFMFDVLATRPRG